MVSAPFTLTLARRTWPHYNTVACSLGFFMGGAGPLGWAVATWCFLHGLFNLWVFCANKNISAEVRSGQFNAATGAGDSFDQVAGGAEWAARNQDTVKAGAQWGANHQGEVRQAAAFAQANPQAARAMGQHAAASSGTTAI